MEARSEKTPNHWSSSWVITVIAVAMILIAAQLRKYIGGNLGIFVGGSMGVMALTLFLVCRIGMSIRGVLDILIGSVFVVLVTTSSGSTISLRQVVDFALICCGFGMVFCGIFGGISGFHIEICCEHEEEDGEEDGDTQPPSSPK